MSVQTEIVNNASSVVYKCNTDFDIPDLDLLTLLFDSEHCSTPDSRVLHADAANPALSLTKRATIDLTKRIAYALRHKFGVGASSTPSYVTVIASGSYILPTFFYGVVAAGGTFCSVSNVATVKELVRLIQLAPSDLVICSDDLVEKVVEAAQECGIAKGRVLVGDPENQTIRSAETRESILSDEKLEWERITDENTLETKPLCLIFSSGTTGLPKGVPLSHRNIVAEVIISCGLQKRQIYEYHPDFEYVTVAHLPIAHIAGLQGFLVNPVFMGGTTYWMPKFDFGRFLEYNRKYQVSVFFTVPPIYLSIAKSPAVTDHFANLKIAYTGAAPMKKDLQEAAGRKLSKSGLFIMQTWGLSESTGSVTLMNYNESDDTGSVSRLLPNMSARVVDESGKDVAAGGEGEIWLKGPVIFRGYHNNPDANAGAFTPDGWFVTGDVGYFAKGLLYLVDRKKELIKYKGLQVAPAELEGMLISHPDILDAAVIGIEWEGTEVPRAYVVVQDRSKTTEDVIKQFVKDNMASYKQLRGGVKYLDAIPKTASGKILRKDLRLLAEKEDRTAKL